MVSFGLPSFLMLCGILLELLAFHCAEKLKYWKPEYWKLFYKVIISKIPALANGVGEVLAKRLQMGLFSF